MSQAIKRKLTEVIKYPSRSNPSVPFQRVADDGPIKDVIM